jgi:hypothetical protein
VQAQEVDVLVDELNQRLLRVIEGAETLAVDEFDDTVNRFVPVLGLIRNVLARHKVKLHRVELLPQELTQQRLIRGHLEAQVVQTHWLKLVEGPLDLEVRGRWVEQARDVEVYCVPHGFFLRLSVDFSHLYFEGQVRETLGNVLGDSERAGLCPKVLGKIDGAWSVVGYLLERSCCAFFGVGLGRWCWGLLGSCCLGVEGCCCLNGFGLFSLDLEEVPVTHEAGV